MLAGSRMLIYCNHSGNESHGFKAHVVRESVCCNATNATQKCKSHSYGVIIIMIYICIYNYGAIMLQSKNVKATSIWSNYDNTPAISPVIDLVNCFLHTEKSKSPTLLSSFCSGKLICWGFKYIISDRPILIFYNRYRFLYVYVPDNLICRTDIYLLL